MPNLTQQQQEELAVTATYAGIEVRAEPAIMAADFDGDGNPFWVYEARRPMGDGNWTPIGYETDLGQPFARIREEARAKLEDWLRDSVLAYVAEARADVIRAQRRADALVHSLPVEDYVVAYNLSVEAEAKARAIATQPQS